jgi:hypothetical protein
MKPDSKQTPLPGLVRSQINKAAHAYALEVETRLRADMLAKVQAARRAGAITLELLALVDAIVTP